ncbi:MAG: GNAT family N-acetyltransferase [Chloroflexota bacterium]
MFLLRDYQPEYADQVNSIAIKAFQQFEGSYSDWDDFIQGVGNMSKLSRSGEIIVAELDGEIVGAVCYIGPNIKKSYFPTESPCIRMLVVDPDARGMGIGRALTQECIDRAKRDQAPHIGLHTSPVMNVALPLYLRMGFKKDADIEPIRGVPYATYYKDLRGL